MHMLCVVRYILVFLLQLTGSAYPWLDSFCFRIFLLGIEHQCLPNDLFVFYPQGINARATHCIYHRLHGIGRDTVKYSLHKETLKTKTICLHCPSNILISFFWGTLDNIWTTHIIPIQGVFSLIQMFINW